MTRTSAFLATGMFLALSTSLHAGDCDGNGLDDSQEIGAKSFLDSNVNGTLDRCEGLSVDVGEISLSAGGQQSLHAELGSAFAGYLYWMLGTTSSDTSSTALGGVQLPLSWDGSQGYMMYTVKHANDGVLASSLGFLDSAGSANARFKLAPGNDPSLVGMTVRHAYIVLTSNVNGVLWASNWVSVTLVP